MINSICQWLRDGGEDTAANLIQECQIDTHYVNTYFEMSGEGVFDLYDVSIAAPRKIHIIIKENTTLSDQIEAAIRGQAEADDVHVRDIRWVPLMTTPLEMKDRELNGILTSFDADHVSRFWQKAISRKSSDPDGAITAARSMLESVCKHVLDSEGKIYDPTSNLPTLVHAALEAIKLAPHQQTDKALRQVMGNCQSIINALASIRNDIGDAHGKREGESVAHSFHAEFIVNLSASVAMFILGQYTHRKSSTVAK